MTLSTRHRIRNMSPGSLRPSYLSVTEVPHNIESSWVSREKTLCFFKTKSRARFKPAISDFPSRQLLPLHQGPRPYVICKTYSIFSIYMKNMIENDPVTKTFPLYVSKTLMANEALIQTCRSHIIRWLAYNNLSLIAVGLYVQAEKVDRLLFDCFKTS